MTEDLVPIKFKRHFAQYDVGDIAGFPKERAEAMVKAGVAEAYAKPATAKPVAAAKGKQADEAKPQF